VHAARADVARALRGEDRRIALMASSRWSHAFLNDKDWRLRPDTVADQELYDAFVAGDHERWHAPPVPRSSTSASTRCLNWFCLLTTMEELGLGLQWSTMVTTRGEPGAGTTRTPGSAGGDGKTDSRKAARRPGNAVKVPSLSEQIQALDRTAPMLPMQPGMCERRTHDYRRHGTTTLFAALEIATGRVTGHCLARHRHQEFLRFLRQITRAYPAVELHLVMDNHAAHKTCTRSSARTPGRGTRRRIPDRRALRPQKDGRDSRNSSRPRGSASRRAARPAPHTSCTPERRRKRGTTTQNARIMTMATDAVMIASPLSKR
jgi:hypothetical protein